MSYLPGFENEAEEKAFFEFCYGVLQEREDVPQPPSMENLADFAVAFASMLVAEGIDFCIHDGGLLMDRRARIQ